MVGNIKDFLLRCQVLLVMGANIKDSLLANNQESPEKVKSRNAANTISVCK